MKYKVTAGVVSLGISRSAYRGDEISGEDLAGVDISRLLKMEAISPLPSEPACPEAVAAEDEPESDELNLGDMTKKELAEYAGEIGLELNPDKMNKAQMIEAIKTQFARKVGGDEIQADESTEDID